MKRHLPNALTLSRLGMAVAIFALLACYDARTSPDAALLDAALVLFLVAGLTDVLDGYLARRIGTPSTFGRISDPLIDKILICGAFVGFAGGNFLRLEGYALVSTTGVAAWMAVVIFARELLVTGIRGLSESGGKAFYTTVFGKAKMFLQSLAVVWILLTVARGDAWGDWARTSRDILIWTTVIFTVASAFVYVGRTRRLMAADHATASNGESGGS